MPRWAKRLLGALAIASALLVVVALALPLVLRGSRLAWAVERATRSFCGTIRIDGGRFAVTAVFDLVFGRSTPVELEGLSVVAPDGEEVIAVARVAARLRFRLRPLRADIDDLRLSSVRWRFVEHPEDDRVDFVDAFKPVPAGGRAQCLAPRPRPAPGARPAPRPAPAAPQTASVEVHRAVLEDVDLRLDFAMWALILDGTSAEGSVGFESGPAGPRLHFEARGIDAKKGGSLRVGRRSQQWAAVTPFDRVQIDRFSTMPDAPADMLLEVARATTGRSTLSGRARFTDIFPWGRRSRWPGLELDARWTDVGDVVEHLKDDWGLERRLPGRLDGDVSATLRGPFVRLAGHFQAKGPHAQFDFGLDRDMRVDAGLALDGIETDGVLDPALVPLLAGRLFGHLHAHVQLGRSLLAMTAAIDEASLRLDRTRRGPWPARFLVSTHALPGDSTPDELGVFFAGAGLAAGTLSLHEVRAEIAGAPASGHISARLFDEDGYPLSAAILDGRAQVQGLALEELVPGGLVHGRVSASGELHGPTGALTFVAHFPPGSSLQS